MNWKWIECINGCIGHRLDPKMDKPNIKAFCPECGSEMVVKNEL